MEEQIMMILLPIVGFMTIALLITLAITIASFFRHKIPFTKLIESSFNDLKKIYTKQLPYLFVFIGFGILIAILIGIQILIGGLYVNLPVTIAMYVLVLLSLIYYGSAFSLGFVNSFNNYLGHKKFKFKLSSFPKVTTYLIVSIIFGLIAFFGLIFLMIPTFIVALMKYPVLYLIATQNIGVFASIKKSFAAFKEHFWDLVFYSFIIGIIGIMPQTLTILPILGEVLNGLIQLFFVVPFSIVLATKLMRELNIN